VPENELDVPSEKTYSILRKKKEERMEGGSTETTKPGICAK